MSVRALRLALLLALLALVGCDHATKAAALRGRSEAPVRVVPGAVDLVYAENHDVAFSALAHVDIPHRPVVLAVVPVLLSVLLLVRLFQRRKHGLAERSGYLLLAAGALGNAIDRVARGHVVDFIHVHHWPVFNVADVLVVAGVLLLALASLQKRRSEV